MKADRMECCAQLEEFIQEFYVGHMESLPQSAENKVEALEMYSVSKNYFWNPSLNGYGSLGYVVTADGYKCYFINKKGLPDDIKKNIKGGDAGDGTYFDYVEMNDVYGITTDLKVYYCSNGQDSIIRTTLTDLEKDDPDRSIFSKETEGDEKNNELKKAMYNYLKKYDTDENGTLTSREVKAITSITITPEDNITSFSELYCLTNLNTIKLQNLKIDNLDGFSQLPLLTEITFENCVIGNYNDMAENLNLTFLCFIFNDNNIDSNTEIKKLCGTNGDGNVGISKANFSKLNRLAITGSMLDNGFTQTVGGDISNITDLASLTNLSVATKESINKLNIQNNKLKNIDFLDGFSSVNYINVGYNNLENISGIINCTSLKTFYAYSNGNLGINDGDDVNDENNALYVLQSCPSLEVVSLWQGDFKIKYISYIMKLPNLKNFECGASNLNIDDLNETKTFLKNLKDGYRLNTKYAILLLDESSTELSISEQSIDREVFLNIANYKKITNLCMERIKIVDSSNMELSADDTNQIINQVLSQLPNLTKLDVCGTKMKTIDFVVNSETNEVNTKKLKVFHCLGTNITDLTNLEKVTITGLGINNANINLASIQNTICNCSNGNYNHGYTGLYIGNADLLKKLENCTKVTSICMYYVNWAVTFKDTSLDLSLLTALTDFTLEGLNLDSIILPNNVQNIDLENTKTFPNLSNLSNLKKLTYKKGGSYDSGSVSNVIDSLKSKTLNSDVTTEIYLNNIKDLVNLVDIGNKFNCTKLDIQNCTNMTSLNGISSMSNLTEINCVNDTSLVNITEVGSLTSLTKLTLNNCGITNLSEISGLSALNYIDLRNNPLANKEGDVDNLQILADLRTNKSDLKVCLSGCKNILDWSKLSSFGSWWKDSEKAGY